MEICSEDITPLLFEEIKLKQNYITERQKNWVDCHFSCVKSPHFLKCPNLASASHTIPLPHLCASTCKGLHSA